MTMMSPALFGKIAKTRNTIFLLGRVSSPDSSPGRTFACCIARGSLRVALLGEP